jgi:hypothetical protein
MSSDAAASASNNKRQANNHLTPSAAKKKKAATPAAENNGCPCECAFPHCTLPCAAPEPWCAQHGRILSAGGRAMEKAFDDYADGYDMEQRAVGDDAPVDIFALLPKTSTAAEAEALYAMHCYMTQDPPGQLDMGGCSDCGRFQLFMNRVNDDHMPVCEPCWESAVAAAAAE